MPAALFCLQSWLKVKVEYKFLKIGSFKIYKNGYHGSSPLQLLSIGNRFSIGDSSVAFAYSRFLNEVKTDRRLGRQVDEIEKNDQDV